MSGRFRRLNPPLGAFAEAGLASHLGSDVNRSTLTTLLCGGVAALMGLFYVLQAAGVVVSRPGHDDERGVAVCIGAVFMAGGVAAMLTTARGPAAQMAIRLLGFAIVVGFTAITAWIAVGPGARDFASPFAVFGHRANEISGRIFFGFAALICLMVTMGAARTMFRPGRSAAVLPPPD